MARAAGELPGSAPPGRRLAVTPRSGPGDRPGLTARLGRPARIRLPSAFPVTRPTWPGAVPRPPVEKTLGMAYDSDWARRYPARWGRAAVQQLVAAPVVRALASPRITGLDRLAPLDVPVIFAANHASHIDAPLLVSVIPDRWRRELFVAGAADYFFDTRLKATAFAFFLNAVPIERQRVSRDSANRVARLLQDGWSMLIFPEGGRSPDGWGQPHRAGAAWLAVRTGTPIVPVHVEGTRDILAKGSRRIRPGTSRVTFGRPLGAEPGSDPRLLADRVERAIEALADEVGTDWWTARRRAAARTSPTLTGPDAGQWRRSWALGESAARKRRAGRAERWPRD
jgi:1-acyl-sn-glycerol-3-phosphate acyltransferase